MRPSLSSTDVNPVSAQIVLFIWGVLESLAFLAQQRRLLDMVAEHTNAILALNNSTLYLGITGEAAPGGVTFQFALINAFGEHSCAYTTLITCFFVNTPLCHTWQRGVFTKKQVETVLTRTISR